ncbi:MAG TPA: DUF3833 family protein [Sphingomicrobium sp.]
MRIATAAAIVALATGIPSAAADPGPRLDMLAFFTGKTYAENVMKIVLKRPARLIVESVGGKGDRGDFVLIDTVREEGKPERTRKWVMRQTAPNRFTGALSDATGPVDVTVDGDEALILYTMKGGLKVRQEMKLLADGRTLSNRVVVKKFGLKFATVDGKIRKLD